jgi:hypothetical protein
MHLGLIVDRWAVLSPLDALLALATTRDLLVLRKGGRRFLVYLCSRAVGTAPVAGSHIWTPHMPPVQVQNPCEMPMRGPEVYVGWREGIGARFAT